MRLVNHARSQKISSGVLLITFFSVNSSYFTEGHVDLRREAIRPKGCPIASRGGSVPEILRKSTATCYYSGGEGSGGGSPISPLGQPMLICACFPQRFHCFAAPVKINAFSLGYVQISINSTLN